VDFTCQSFPVSDADDYLVCTLGSKSTTTVALTVHEASHASLELFRQELSLAGTKASFTCMFVNMPFKMEV
jgi:hypothetical protein